MPVPLIIAIVVGVILVVLIIIGLVSRKPADSLQARLAEYSMRETPATLEEIELSQPFRERILAPTVQRAASFVTRFTPANTLESTRHNLDLAGNPNNWTPSEFFGIRAIASVVLGGLIFLLLTLTKSDTVAQLGMTVLFTVLGFVLPGLWLGSKIRSRKANVIRALPDALDLLTICVEAGLGFDQAMQKVAEKWDNELSRAFGRVLHEIRLGKTRREALRDVAQRIDVGDVTSFIAAVIQSEQTGRQHCQGAAYSIRSNAGAPPPARGGESASSAGQDAVPDGLPDLPRDLGGVAGASDLAGDVDEFAGRLLIRSVSAAAGRCCDIGWVHRGLHATSSRKSRPQLHSAGASNLAWLYRRAFSAADAAGVWPRARYGVAPATPA